MALEIHDGAQGAAVAFGQLGAYARALGYRAGIAPGEIRCGWFDEEDFFGFGW